MQINSDGSSAKKIAVASGAFMGLAHLLYLKQYIKGAFFALIELVFLATLPITCSKIYNYTECLHQLLSIVSYQRAGCCF